MLSYASQNIEFQNASFLPIWTNLNKVN